jgi:hypothetical protein
MVISSSIVFEDRTASGSCPQSLRRVNSRPLRGATAPRLLLVPQQRPFLGARVWEGELLFLKPLVTNLTGSGLKVVVGSSQRSGTLGCAPRSNGSLYRGDIVVSAGSCMVESHTTFCFADTMKVFEEKMPSGRRNGATRTMKSRTMPCNVSTCSLNTVDQKGSCFNNDLCDAHGAV